MEAKLVVLEGKNKDQEIPLPETIFLIGRDTQCHLRPHCQLVSKLHCAIVPWAGRLRVRDLKSRNGTFLNDQPIHGEVVAIDGDQLRVGSLLFAVRVSVGGTAPRVPSIKERDVKWLLDAPADSGVLSPSIPTVIVDRVEVSASAGVEDTDAGALSPTAEAPPVVKKRGSKSVSAGQHLREYFERRKLPPKAAGRKSPPN
jgi:pSer/pThr/pTyr-binding forkhead associated (FHA) protein